MKKFAGYRDLLDAGLASEITDGRKGWTKAKCEGCDVITLWNTKKTGKRCNEGSCANCGGPVKRTVWSLTSSYIVQE